MNPVEIPESWRRVRLGSLCAPVEQVNAGKLTVKDFTYVDVSSVDNRAKRVVNAKKIRPKMAPSRARQQLKTGDVLVSTVRPNLNAVCLVPPELGDAIGSSAFCVLRPQEALLDANYLFSWVQSVEFVGRLTKMAQGAGYPAVTDSDVLGQRIPLPPLSEQRRIVEILKEADAIRDLRRQAEHRLDDLISSIYIRFLERTAARCVQKRVGDIVDFIGGGTPEKKVGRYWNGAIPWVSPKDMKKVILSDTEDHITEEAVSESATAVVPANAILLVVRSGVLAHSVPIAQILKPMAINQDMKALLPKKGYNIRPLLLLAWGLTRRDLILKCVKRGPTVHSIELDQFRRLDFPLPLDEKDQEALESQINEAIALMELQESGETLNEKLRSALNLHGFNATLTHGYRVTNHVLLGEEATERDALLAETGASVVAPPKTEPTPNLSPFEGREAALAALSGEQKKLLAVLGTLKGPNTFQEIHDHGEASAWPPKFIQQSLQLFTQMGLLICVTRADQQAERGRQRTHYYRLPLDSDDGEASFNGLVAPDGEAAT